MKLYSIYCFILVTHCRYGTGRCACQDFKSFRHFYYMIPMTHPYIESRFHIIKNTYGNTGNQNLTLLQLLSWFTTLPQTLPFFMNYFTIINPVYFTRKPYVFKIVSFVFKGNQKSSAGHFNMDGRITNIFILITYDRWSYSAGTTCQCLLFNTSFISAYAYSTRAKNFNKVDIRTFRLKLRVKSNRTACFSNFFYRQFLIKKLKELILFTNITEEIKNQKGLSLIR